MPQRQKILKQHSTYRHLKGSLFNYSLNFLNINVMKHSQLSQFQKQQYTHYLQQQLQKFSAFMLHQQQHNSQHQTLLDTLQSHSQLLPQLQQQLRIVEVYQQELLGNQQHLNKDIQTLPDLEHRFRRLEDRERFNCDQNAKQARKQSARQEEIRDKNSQSTYVNLNKRLKVIEEKIGKTKEHGYSKFSDSEVVQLVEEETRLRGKKIEKKMKKYFNQKFQDIEFIMKKSKKHKSKSPLSHTPIQMSTMSRYEVECSDKPLSQFRLQDYSTNKHQQSTILRESKNTTVSNRRKATQEPKPKKIKAKGKENDRSKSKSKSKSKSQRKQEKDKNRKKKGDKSRSKSRDMSVSGISDNSWLSSISRSKSHLSRDASLTLQERKKHKKGKRHLSISKSKSRKSSVSLHQKCKKRPEIEQLFPKQKSRDKIHPKKTHKSKH